MGLENVFLRRWLLFFDRDRAPPHAALRGGVPPVCLPLDEQPLDEGVATTLHNQTVGHLPGTHRHTHACTRTPDCVDAICLKSRANQYVITVFDEI